MKGNKKKVSKVLLSSTLLLTMFFTTMPTSVFAAENAASSKTGDVDVEISKTNFPDDVFRGYVKAFDTDKDGSLSPIGEIDKVTEIAIYDDKGIKDLTGIGHFTKLTHLACTNNQLTSLDVSGNVDLKELSCNDNQLTSLGVSNNTKLTHLSCENNQLTSLNIINNTLLEQLSCFNNQLKDLDVSANIALKYLDCANNSLTSLNVNINTALTHLDCENNSLRSLDVNENKDLINLSCKNNPLTSLDVRANTKLTDLNCGNTSLTSLDVRANTKLTDLRCYITKLTSLDVSNNTALKNLDCSESQLTSLNVSNNTALTTFDCSSQKRTLTYDKNKGYRLQVYDKGFDNSKATNFVGATNSEGTLTGVVFDKPITYDYNTGYARSGAKPMNVTLTFNATDATKLEDAKTLAEKAITGISATNETTNKIILDAVTKSVSSIDGVSAAWKAGSPTITLATKDTAGSIKGTIVLTSGSKTMEVTVDKLIEKLTTATPDKPTITVGSGSNHQVNTSNDMTFTCSGKLEDLNGVYVDGKLVAESNYTLKSGSTILTLKSSYLDTLSVGKHILKFQYKDNVAAETNFTITTKTSTPNTGDTSNTMLCFGLMILSGCLAGYSLKKKKALRS